MTLVVQVDGRVRDRLALPTRSRGGYRCAAWPWQARQCSERCAAGPVARIVYVPGRLINIVTG